MAQPQVDPERQRKARAHARIQRRLMLFSLTWNGAILLAWLFSGGSAALSQFLLSLTPHPWLVVAGYGAVFGAGLMLVNLPLSFYSEFILQHRFGLSNQSVEDWIRDQAKGLLISAPIGLLMLELVYAVLRAFPNTW